MLVLIPGGTFHMGAQKEDPEAPNFSPVYNPDEQPVHEVTLAPYFLSKYELTQAQWLAFTGTNPSIYVPGRQLGDKTHSLLHPVENVTWFDCEKQLRAHGPPPAHGGSMGVRRGARERPAPGGGARSRATASSPGTSPTTSARTTAAPPGFPYNEWDDGYTAHAPVGVFRPNPFGLYDVAGNVWEWCQDYTGSYELPVREGTGERIVEDAKMRTARGGAFTFAVELTASANRYPVDPEVPIFMNGVRPARRVD